MRQKHPLAEVSCDVIGSHHEIGTPSIHGTNLLAQRAKPLRDPWCPINTSGSWPRRLASEVGCRRLRGRATGKLLRDPSVQKHEGSGEAETGEQWRDVRVEGVDAAEGDAVRQTKRPLPGVLCASGSATGMELAMKRKRWKPPLRGNTRSIRKRCFVCLAKSRSECCSESCWKLRERIGALLADNPRYAPKGIRLFLLQKYRYQCQYCGRALRWNSANAEHVKPWPKGKTTLYNLVASCKPCNKRKLRLHVRGDVAKAVRRGELARQIEEKEELT